MEERYSIVQKIGEGGCGETFLARDNKLGTDCVVKKIYTDREELVESVKRETRALVKIRHTGIPQLTDILYEDNCIYLVMEYIPGESLKDYIKNRGPMPEEDAVKYGMEIAGIMSFLHGLIPPVIHGDLKPANIIMGKRGVSILDFGASFCFDGKSDKGLLAYTKGYSPKEAIEGGRPDVLWDVYAMGAVLFYMVTGEDPGGVRGIYSVKEWDPLLSNELELCILGCCEEDVEKRCRSMEEVIARLSGKRRYNRSNKVSPLLFRPLKSIILTEGKL